MTKALLAFDDKALLLGATALDMILLCQRRGFALDTLLKGSKLFEEDLRKATIKISPQQYLQLVSNCQKALPGPELAYLTAQSWLHHNHSPLLLMLRHSANLQQALLSFYRYRSQLLPLVYIRLQRVQGQLRLVLRPSFALGKQQAFIEQLIFHYLLGLVKQQLGDTSRLSISTTDLDHETSWLYQHQWQLTPDIALQNSLSLPLALLKQSFADANPKLWQQQQNWCLYLQQSIPEKVSFTEQLEQWLFTVLRQSPSQEEAARHWGLSLSSLKRVLAQQHTSYQQLQDQVKACAAQQALLLQGMSNKELAHRLGYSDEHNFRRAFKRWTGLLPSQLRS
ncbi:helix-turn-helix domain-containing protein [Rheinheimera faecalis]